MARFRENVRKVIAAGLPVDATLTALTRDAADTLRVGEKPLPRDEALQVAGEGLHSTQTHFIPPLVLTT
ncbi:MAG: hypothetical protein K8U57_30085 [Planctomycetes bacterium]|nr:hypothetical protein [Planctomycetota bacterium]